MPKYVLNFTLVSSLKVNDCKIRKLWICPYMNYQCNGNADFCCFFKVGINLVIFAICSSFWLLYVTVIYATIHMQL